MRARAESRVRPRGRAGTALITAALLAATAALTAPSSIALPVSTDGLVVTSAAIEVQSVAAPTTWVPTTTVYEGSPTRLVMAVEAPEAGVVQTTVTLPGRTSAVADASTSVSAGASTVTVPLDLSYGAWLAGSVQNTADHLDVDVSFTRTPPAAPASTATPSASPSATPSATPTPTPSASSSPEPEPTPSAAPLPRPVRVTVTGASGVDQRSLRRAIRSLPPGITVIAVIRASTRPDDDCPTRRQLARMVADAAESTGRTVRLRTGSPVARGCARLDLSYTEQPRTRTGVRTSSRLTTTSATFDVPIVMAPRPLIMIHGMWSSASVWSTYTQSGNRLITRNSQWRGYAVNTMDTGSALLPYAAVNTVAQNAGLAWTYIQGRMQALNAHEVDVLAHSLGGVITRRMLHDTTNGQAAQDAIRSVVLLGTPNGGSSCSTAWQVPANSELTYTAMDSFNVLYPGYPGAFTTSLYSDHFGSTCFDANAGDLFVPAWSTQAQAVDVVTRISPGIQHANMTSDNRLFTDYVLATLALPSAPASSGPTARLTNPAASSTVLFEGTASGSPLTVTRTVTIESGRSLVASVVADSGATGTLTYPSGSGTASVALTAIGDYPVFEGEVSYATLGGTGTPVTVSVTIDATTTAASPEWRWSLVSRR